jgi:hypothetical protein
MSSAIGVKEVYSDRYLRAHGREIAVWSWLEYQAYFGRYGDSGDDLRLS